MSSLEKLIKIVNNAINGIVQKVKLTKSEVAEIEEVLYEFSFLYCYPNDHKYYNSTILGQGLEHSRFLQDIYYEGTEEYEIIMENEELAHNINSFGIYVKDDYKNKKNTHICRQKFPFIKQGKGVKKFCYYIANDEVYNKKTVTYGRFPLADFLIPTVLKENQKQELINSKYFLGQQDNIYSFKLIHPMFYEDRVVYTKNIICNLKQSVVWFNQELSKYRVEYIDVDGVLIEREYYESGDYNIEQEAKRTHTHLYFIDEKGTHIDNSTLDPCETFHDIRTAIAHCRSYDYHAYKNNDANFSGKTYFIIKQNKNKEIVVTRAVLCPPALLESMNYCNCFNYNPEKRKFYFVYFPKLTEKITTEEQAKNFQDECVVVKINLNKEVDEHYFTNIVLQTFRNYNNSNQDELLIDYVKNNLKDKFNISSIKILPITDEKWLNQKFKENKDFYTSKFEDVESQNNYVENILFNLCDAISLTEEWKEAISLENKKKRITEEKRYQYLGGGVYNIIKNINALIQYWQDDSDKKYDFQSMVLYKTEVYSVLCMIVAYATLVKNGFAEKIEITNGLELTKLYSYHNKINEEKMDIFTVYPLIKNIDRTGKKLKSTDDKLKVIKYIRNAICHNGIYIKLDGSYDYKDNKLVFVHESDDENVPDMAVVVSCKDFLEFCMHPLYRNYNPGNKLIEGVDFKDVERKITEKLINPEDLIS